MWPQIVVICLFVANFVIQAAFHGKPKTGNFSVFNSLIFIALWAWVLDAGGFFNVLKG